MIKQIIGFVSSILDFKTIKILYPYLKIHKKYNIKQKKYRTYLVEDSRQEAKIGDWVIIEKINPKSKNKFFKLIKIIKNYGTSRNSI